MESETTQSEDQSGTASSGGDQTVLLSILSQSPDTPQRYTFENLPLSTRVSEIKARITLAVPSRPDSEIQRLLYRGKVLANNAESLENIVDHSASNVHSMRLILPPSNADPPTTSASGSSGPQLEHHLSDPVPNQGSDDDNTPGLRYRGARREAGDRLRRYMRDFDAAVQNMGQGVPHQPPANTTSNATNPPDIPPPEPVQHGNTLFRNQHTPNSSTIFLPMEAAPRHGLLYERPVAPQVQPSPFPARNQAPLPPSAHFHHRHDPLHQNGSSSADGRRQQLAQLFQRILTLENQVRAGTAPSVEEISQVRLQLHELLDEQYRNPFELREASLEAWLSRLSTTAMRADQLRIGAGHGPSTTTARGSLGNVPTTGLDASQGQMYMVSSPEGPYGIVMPPSGGAGIQPQAIPSFGNAAGGGRPTMDGRRRPPMPAFRVDPNVPLAVRRRRSPLAAIDLLRITRGLWLFIRLYFFCYVLTPHGSWARTIFVILSAFTAIASQTTLPQWARSIVWDPIRRHLENLVLLDRHAAPPVANRNRGVGNSDNEGTPNFGPGAQGSQSGGGRAAPPGPAPTISTMLREYAIVAERAIVVFLATLIPGIGERYVTARNTAETAERREQEGQGDEGGEDERGQQHDFDADNGNRPDVQDEHAASSSGAAHSPANETHEEAGNNQQAEVDVRQ